jgi:DNA/RNA endonuclease YhcR with UshA esterase domain
MKPRLPALSALVIVAALAAAGAQEGTKTVSPEEAAKKVNETVTLRMVVKSATLRGVCFLNSHEDYKDDKNFTVFLPREAVEKFKEAKVDDPAKHFKGKTILVTGKVTLYREKPQIRVEDPKQIRLAEKQEEKKSPN